MVISTSAFVEAYMEASYGQLGNIHINTEDNERLWVHDFLHAVLAQSPRTGSGEEATAIYQAVLLRDHEVKERRRIHKDYGHDVTLQDVQQEIVPKVREFVTRVASRYDLPNEMRLSEHEIRQHYQCACQLRQSIKERFGKEFGELTVVEIKETPPATFLKMVDESRASIFAQDKPSGQARTR